MPFLPEAEHVDVETNRALHVGDEEDGTPVYHPVSLSIGCPVIRLAGEGEATRRARSVQVIQGQVQDDRRLQSVVRDLESKMSTTLHAV